MMILKSLFALILTVVCMQLSAAHPECSICGEKVGNRYMKGANDQVFCSRDCFEKTLPRCAYCNELCKQRFIKAANKKYCSKKCAEADLLERCRSCGKPAYKGNIFEYVNGKHFYCMPCCSNNAQCLLCHRPEREIRQLANGNTFCRDCDRDIIEDMEDLQLLFNEVRAFLNKHFNFPQDHDIKLEMRSFEQFEGGKLKKRQELGLYQFRGNILYTSGKSKVKHRLKKLSCTVIIMESLPRRKAAEVIAHELAHDYMQHRWYFISDIKIKEGFAEFVASEFNKRAGYGKWNYRMEINKDPVYGDGYRMVRNWAKQGSWQGVFRQLDRANRKAMPPELKDR